MTQLIQEFEDATGTMTGFDGVTKYVNLHMTVDLYERIKAALAACRVTPSGESEQWRERLKEQLRGLETTVAKDGALYAMGWNGALEAVAKLPATPAPPSQQSAEDKPPRPGKD